jgi:hypothetical protein
MSKTAPAPKEPPWIAQTAQWLAQLGGFLGRKSDGRPGDTVVWRGLQRLNDIVEAWRAFGAQPGLETTAPPKKEQKDVGNAQLQDAGAIEPSARSTRSFTGPHPLTGSVDSETFGLLSKK